MKKTTLALWLLCQSLSLVAAQEPAPAKADPEGPSIKELSWMEGDWETVPGPRQIDEHWTHVAGGTMFGTSRTVQKERTLFFEFLRIETRKTGVFYVAQPMGRSATDFKLVKVEGKSAVFENLAHDFPKRILYRLDEKGRLAARIEGDGTEKEKPQDFVYLSRAR